MRVKKHFLIGVLVFNLLACFRTSPSPTYYVLQSNTATGEQFKTGSKSGGEMIAVERVHIPRYLNRSEIVLDSSSGELKLENYELWAEPLDEALTRILVENLQAFEDRLGQNFAGNDEAVYAKRKLFINIQRFDCEAQGDCFLRARCWLKNAAAKEQQQFFTYSLSQHSPDSSILSNVRTLSQLLAELAKELSEDLRNV